MSGIAKVVFRLEADAWHGHAAEGLWADVVSENRYRLRNSPFYARDVSFGDVVFVQLGSDDRLLFAGVSLRGGHSTYRLMLAVDAGSEGFLKRWHPLHAMGCGYEGVSGKLLAVDVPPSANIHAVYALLEAGESDGVWEFEEGHCGHPLT